MTLSMTKLAGCHGRAWLLADLCSTRGEASLPEFTSRYTKFIEYTTAGIPTLASNVGMYAILGSVNVCGLVSEPDEWELEIRRFMSDRQLRNSMLQDAADYSKSNYSPRIVGRVLLENIMQLFENPVRRI